MSFYLENFELHFPPELLAPGEKLHEGQDLIGFNEVERNLWSFEILDTETFEVEILITPSKVKSYSCDCNLFREQKACAHLIASLYKLRSLKTKKVHFEISTEKIIPKKLTILSILNQIPADDLKNFMRSYARRNKQFATALKANFARSIELENNEEKYEGILNSIVKPATEQGYKLSHSTIKQFFQVAEQFTAQYEDAISLKQYREAYYIIKALLAKSAYINHWTNSENQDVIDLCLKLHKQLDFLLRLSLAPELKEEAIAFSIDLAGRTYYHYLSSTHNLLFILQGLTWKDEQKAELVETLELKLRSEQLHEREVEYLWSIRQYFIDKELELKPRQAPVASSQSVYRICKQIEDLKAYNGLRQFLELFRYKGKIRDSKLIKFHLNALYKLGLKDTLIQECFDNLMIHKDVFYYDLLKKSFPESKELFFEKIQKSIKDKSKKDFQDLYLDVCVSDENVEVLVDFISMSDFALEHLYQYAHFIQNNSEHLAELVVLVSDNYLNEYLGVESASEMRKLLIFLRKNEWSQAYKKLKKHLEHDFADRQSIKEEIIKL